jgi:probable F420-dependent oxidoreductase
MRFSYAESFCDPQFLIPLAQAAEEAGYSSFVVPDSLIYPAESDTSYPYTDSGDRDFLEDKPIIEAMTLTAALGAVTERLLFTTFVLKLPVRPAVLVAKQAASIACLTGNRLKLGVGVSPWPEDFAAMGQPWEGRGQRMDEAIEVIRGLTSGGWFEHHGQLLDVARMKICPTPTEPIPILIGGHSDRALRRAARAGDGWVHAGGDPDTLASLLDRLQQFRQDEATAHKPFEIHVISLDAFSVEGVHRLEDLGVTDVIVGFSDPYSPEPDPQSLNQKLELLRGFADDVIGPVRQNS